MSWTNTGGGDHEGAAWTPADTTIISGVHYNISTFTGTNGETLNINPGYELEIYAHTIIVSGTINGDADGYAGGHSGGASGAGTGAGAGGGTNGGGGGGGYGGSGGSGEGAEGGAGGGTYDPTTGTIISMGSGGGSGYTTGGNGGNGGAGITLSANTVTISGTISVDGETGDTGGSLKEGGGGGSGGGLLVVGCSVTISGTISADGGNGGANAGNDGGGGGGGRVKIYYRTLNTAGSTITVALGAAGGAGAGAGSIGSNFNDEMAQCTSTLEFGQTFTPGITGKVAVSVVKLWVNSVATSGDFTLTVYDDTGKGTNYGSKSITVSGTGETTWTFDSWVELPNGTSQYYLELVADAGGDIDLAVYGNTPIVSEYYYFNSGVLTRFSAYIKIDVLGHVIDPQIYNTADTTVKCNITNTMLVGAVHRINTDGTGTVEHDDDFTTAKWKIDSTHYGVTHDTGNDELDIADDGYIYWKKDTKFPIDGIPTLTARINITSGTPTIQISDDAATWYDIDTAIADDVETVYPLDDYGNLSLAGKTVFYWRFDCVKAALATASIKSFELDIDIHTIYAKNPVITKGATASTYRIDQDADSGMACNVELIFPDRWWA